MDDSLEDVQHKELHSSWLVYAIYNRRTQSLTLTTNTGRAYEMSGVPPDMFEGLVNAGSAGKYFNTYLKGQY